MVCLLRTLHDGLHLVGRQLLAAIVGVETVLLLLNIGPKITSARRSMW